MGAFIFGVLIGLAGAFALALYEPTLFNRLASKLREWLNL